MISNTLLAMGFIASALATGYEFAIERDQWTYAGLFGVFFPLAAAFEWWSQRKLGEVPGLVADRMMFYVTMALFAAAL